MHNFLILPWKYYVSGSYPILVPLKKVPVIISFHGSATGPKSLFGVYFSSSYIFCFTFSNLPPQVTTELETQHLYVDSVRFSQR